MTFRQMLLLETVCMHGLMVQLLQLLQEVWKVHLASLTVVLDTTTTMVRIGETCQVQELKPLVQDGHQSQPGLTAKCLYHMMVHKSICTPVQLKEPVIGLPTLSQILTDGT